MLWFWGVMAVVALGVEMMTGALYLALVSVGALAGLGAGAAGAPPNSWSTLRRRWRARGRALVSCIRRRHRGALSA